MIAENRFPCTAFKRLRKTWRYGFKEKMVTIKSGEIKDRRDKRDEMRK